VPGADDLTADPQPSFLPWSGTSWLYVQLDSRARHAAGAVPRGRDERHVDRRLGREPPALPRAAAPGRVGDGGAAARAWSSTGTGTRSTTARRCTGAGSSATASSPAASTPSWRGRRRAQARRPDLDEPAPAADVAVLVSAESRWAMEFVGPLPGRTPAWMGDPQSYERILAAFYRGLFDAGLKPTSSRPRSCRRPRAAASAGPCSSCPGSTSPTTRCCEACALRGGRRPSVLTPAHGLRRRGGRPPATRSCRRAARGGGAHYLEYTNLARRRIAAMGAGASRGKRRDGGLARTALAPAERRHGARRYGASPPRGVRGGDDATPRRGRA
jgi:beta-galactosidase